MYLTFRSDGRDSVQSAAGLRGEGGRTWETRGGGADPPEGQALGMGSPSGVHAKCSEKVSTGRDGSGGLSGRREADSPGGWRSWAWTGSGGGEQGQGTGEGCGSGPGLEPTTCREHGAQAGGRVTPDTR